MVARIVRYRLIVGLVFIVATAVAGWRTTRTELDLSFDSLFRMNTPEMRETIAFQEHFETTAGSDVIVIVRSEELFTKAFLGSIGRLTRRIETTPGVESVESLTNAAAIETTEEGFRIEPLFEELPADAASLSAARESALSQKRFRRRLVSDDGRTTALYARLKKTLDEESKRRPVIDSIRQSSEEILPGSAEINYTGYPVIEGRYSDLLFGSLSRFVPITIALIGICLFFTFRNVLGLVVPLSVVGIATLWTMGAVELLGIRLGMVTSAVPSMIMILGVADSIHMISRYYEEIGRGASRLDAISAMMRRVGWACFLTSFTTAVGFLSLLLARIESVREMGLVMGIGVMLTFVCNVTLTPVALSLFPRPRRGVRPKLESGLTAAVLGRAALLTRSKAPAILAVSALFIAVAVAALPRIEVGQRVLDEIGEEDEASIALRAFEQHLMGTDGADVSLRAPDPGAFKDPLILAKMTSLQETIDAHPAILKTWSLADLVEEMHRAMGENGSSRLPNSSDAVAQYLLLYAVSDGDEMIDGLVSADYSWTRIEFRGSDEGTAAFLEMTDAIKARATELFPPPFEVDVVGDGVISSLGVNNIILDMLRSFGGAFIFIAFTMIIVLRSVRLGLLSLIPNVLPMLLCLGTMALIGYNIRISTALILAMSLGIAVDDTIHILVRYRRERAEGRDDDEAMRRTLLSSGRAIVFTSLILIIGFQALLASDFLSTRQMAVQASFILGIALAADILLLPVLIRLFACRKKALGLGRGEPRVGALPPAPAASRAAALLGTFARFF